MQIERAKIAFVVQRYGLEVNGGAEQHCRLLAERLTEHYQVEVLTSCAHDYLTWDNYYPEGTENINGVKVHRFPTVVSRQKGRGNYRFIRRRKLWQKALKTIRALNTVEKIVPTLKPTEAAFKRWAYEQGPAVPGLIAFLEKNHFQYSSLIFFTYLYYTTINGLEVAPAKSILIPTAHDEGPIYIPFFKRVFNAPRVIVYNTAFERQFTNKLFDNSHIESAIAGVGIDNVSSTMEIDLKERFNISKDYLIYIGRVEAGKGCKTLIRDFKRYNRNRRLQLVLVGQLFMEVPPDPDIITLGFVSDEIKSTILAKAKALIMPSLYESLSMVTLEAMQLKKPVIVNGKCEVLKQHIEVSKAGFAYYSYRDFAHSIDTLLSDEKMSDEIGKAGERYVQSYYDWRKITAIFVEMIEKIKS